MQILHIIPSLHGGGAERQLLLLAKEQAKHGHDVSIATRKSNTPSLEVGPYRIKIYSVGNLPGPNPLLLFKIFLIILKIKPTIIQTWLFQMDVIGGLAAIILNKKWVMTERTNPKYTNTYWDKARFFLARYSNLIVTNSDSSMKFWSAKLKNNIVIKINNSVNLEDIHNVINNYESVLDKSTFLIPGRLMPSKNQEMVIRAVNLIKNKNFKVLILGDGPSKSKLEQLIFDLGLQNIVKINDYDDNWWRHLNSINSVISTSRFEGQSNVIIETLIAKCPVILSDIESHREFDDSDYTKFINLNSDQSLADAILYNLQNYRTLINNSEKLSNSNFASKYNVIKIYKKYDEAYNSLI